MPEELNELRERARRVERHGLTERVRIDQHTYEQLVEFVEAERCSLKEALRRAVRLGVQVLLSERQTLQQSEPWGPAVSSNLTTPSFGMIDNGDPMAGQRYTELHAVERASLIESIPAMSGMQRGDGLSDYARTRPPGLA